MGWRSNKILLLTHSIYLFVCACFCVFVCIRAHLRACVQVRDSAHDQFSLVTRNLLHFQNEIQYSSLKHKATYCSEDVSQNRLPPANNMTIMMLDHLNFLLRVHGKHLYWMVGRSSLNQGCYLGILKGILDRIFIKSSRVHVLLMTFTIIHLEYIMTMTPEEMWTPNCGCDGLYCIVSGSKSFQY